MQRIRPCVISCAAAPAAHRRARPRLADRFVRRRPCGAPPGATGP